MPVLDEYVVSNRRGELLGYRHKWVKDTREARRFKAIQTAICRALESYAECVIRVQGVEAVEVAWRCRQ